MRRMLLIALRELLENVRTKGFWISILMMPVILALVGIVPILAESTRSAKVFAVVDTSGWVREAVQGAIDKRDFEQLLDNFNQEEGELLEPTLGKVLGEIRVLDEIQRQAVLDAILDGEPVSDSLPRRLQRHLENHASDIGAWWNNLDPLSKAKLAPGITTNHFVEVSSTGDIDALNVQLKSGELFAYFIIGPKPLESSEGSRYVSNNLTDIDLERWYSGYISRVVRDERLARSNIDEETATWINEPIEFEGVQLDDQGQEEEVDSTDIARQWAPVGFVYFLWISVLINTQMLITNTIEEKSNKLIEVLLSSVSPVTLMGGKILGIAATGLTIILSWLTMALVFFIGLPLAAGVTLPIDLSSVLAEPHFLISFVVYFVLGYLFYAALLVGLGSVCNNLKEAQNLILPVQMIQILPLLMMIPIGRDPNGTLAQVMSYIPPLTPFVMMNRAAGPPTAMEYAITTALMIVSTVLAFWLAAKVFRVGILMTGKPPGFMEIFRLLRAPV